MSYNNEQAEPLKYNICSSEANIFTKSELFSMVFQDITNTYSIPREATREIVRLFKSMLEDNLLSNNVPLGKYLIIINLPYQKFQHLTFYDMTIKRKCFMRAQVLWDPQQYHGKRDSYQANKTWSLH